MTIEDHVRVAAFHLRCATKLLRGSPRSVMVARLHGVAERIALMLTDVSGDGCEIMGTVHGKRTLKRRT